MLAPSSAGTLNLAGCPTSSLIPGVAPRPRAGGPGLENKTQRRVPHLRDSLTVAKVGLRAHARTAIAKQRTSHPAARASSDATRRCPHPRQHRIPNPVPRRIRHHRLQIPRHPEPRQPLQKLIHRPAAHHDLHRPLHLPAVPKRVHLPPRPKRHTSRRQHRPCPRAPIEHLKPPAHGLEQLILMLVHVWRRPPPGGHVCVTTVNTPPLSARGSTISTGSPNTSNCRCIALPFKNRPSPQPYPDPRREPVLRSGVRSQKTPYNTGGRPSLLRGALARDPWPATPPSGRPAAPRQQRPIPTGVPQPVPHPRVQSKRTRGPAPGL